MNKARQYQPKQISVQQLEMETRPTVSLVQSPEILVQPDANATQQHEAGHQTVSNIPVQLIDYRVLKHPASPKKEMIDLNLLKVDSFDT